MKIPTWSFVLILVFTSFASSSAQSESEKAAAALKILNAYHAENPEPGDRAVHIICWRPQDRDFAKDYQERLTRIMEHIQKFYQDEMERNGFGKRTFQLNYADPDKKQIKIHEAIGNGKFADYNKPDGERVAKDCRAVLKEAGIDANRETIVIFTNLVDWDEEKLTFVHKSPYYARGNSRNGVAWQLDSAELDIPNIALKEPIISDGEYGRISLGKHNSIFIGGIAHELGHALGLPHCRERQDEKAAHGTALMGAGNRSYGDEIRGEGKGSFIPLAHALRLASHPQFSGSVKGMNLPVRADFSDIEVKAKENWFTVSGKVTSEVPVYAVIAYLDPNGGGDYDSKTVTAVPDAEGNFKLDCEPLHRKNPLSEIRVLALMANGVTSTWKSTYRMINGTPDISLMQTTAQLAEFETLLSERKPGEAQKIANQLPKDSIARTIATNILEAGRPNRKTTAIAEIPGETKTFPLSKVTPTAARIGYGRPIYDHLPRKGMILSSGGRLFTTGIYAHAPAVHTYELPEDSNWTKLRGICGLPDQQIGSVGFEIKADGKSVYKSPVMKPGKTQAFDIPLTGVKKLELITTDGGDGIRNDWAYWFDTHLER